MVASAGIGPGQEDATELYPNLGCHCGHQRKRVLYHLAIFLRIFILELLLHTQKLSWGRPNSFNECPIPLLIDFKRIWQLVVSDLLLPAEIVVKNLSP